MEKYFKSYGLTYFDICMESAPENVNISLSRWTKLMDESSSPDARAVYAQFKNAALASVMVSEYCDMCSAIYKRTRRGYKIDIAQDGIKYFYSLSALMWFTYSTLAAIPGTALDNRQDGGRTE